MLHLALNRIYQLLLDPVRDHSNGPVESVGDRLPITTSVTDGTDPPRPQQWSAAILGVVESTADFLQSTPEQCLERCNIVTVLRQSIPQFSGQSLEEGF